MQILKHIALCVVAGALTTGAHASFIPYELQIDVNGLTIDAGGAFNANTHTGSLVISSSGSSSLTAIVIDGNVQGVSATLSGFSGLVNMNAGVITGGSFSVLLSDGSSYSASLDPTFATIFLAGTNEYIGDGDTAGGVFANLGPGSSLGGVDVSPWDGAGAQGFFFFAGYTPNAGGFSAGVDLNLWVIVPTPGSGLLTACAVALCLRRRRV